MPIVSKRPGIDPALATGPFVTTSNDIFGLMISSSATAMLLRWIRPREENQFGVPLALAIECTHYIFTSRSAVDRFADCIAKGRLKQIDADAQRIAAEVRSALGELERARGRYRGGIWDEATTQAYFALYRAAHAALLFKGYHDTNLYGLGIGLRQLYPDDITAEDIDRLRDAKAVKDAVYASGRSTRQESTQLLSWALPFVRRVLTLLALPEFDPAAVETALPEAREHPRPGRRGFGEEPSPQ